MSTLLCGRISLGGIAGPHAKSRSNVFSIGSHCPTGDTAPSVKMSPLVTPTHHFSPLHTGKTGGDGCEKKEGISGIMH